MYDADIHVRRPDVTFHNGNKHTYGSMISNGDMYSQSQMHSHLNTPSVYDEDYLRRSKPIRFDETSSEDNTWVRLYS